MCWFAPSSHRERIAAPTQHHQPPVSARERAVSERPTASLAPPKPIELPPPPPTAPPTVPPTPSEEPRQFLPTAVAQEPDVVVFDNEPSEPTVDPNAAVDESSAEKLTGNKEEDKVYRQMVDKRQSRKVNKEAFVAAIDLWKGSNMNGGNGNGAPGGGKDKEMVMSDNTMDAENMDANSPELKGVSNNNGVGPRRLRAILRKRPLFSYESERGEFDVVSIVGERGVVVHNCCMQPDLKRMFVKHTTFGVGDAFDESVKTPEVCQRGVHPLLANVLAGGCSTLFMYGQTGSGKTHTMSGIEQYASQVLLADAPQASPSSDDSGSPPPPIGHLSFFEIAGTRCIELLGESHGAELPLKQDQDGRVQPIGVMRVPIRSADELLELIKIAKSRRATESTGANAVSSRSHAVCQLTLNGPAARKPKGGLAGGGNRNGRRSIAAARHPILTLVDCAGTERKEDSMWHDADRRKEGAEINQSLHALKECMRHWVLIQEGKKDGNHIPFRESALTRVLADSFMRSDTLITVVGTVSPSATDTEHTLTTLKTVAAVAGTENMIKEVKKDVKPIVQAPKMETIPPKLWTEERLRSWLSSTVSGRGEPLSSALPLVPRGTTGKSIMRMTAVQIRQLWGADQVLADAIFHELRVATKAAEKAKGMAVKGVRQAEMRKKAGVVA